MGLISIVKCAALLSLIIVFEMTWVIAANRSQGLSGKLVSFATGIVMAPIVIYVLVVSLIAVRVMGQLFYQL